MKAKRYKILIYNSALELSHGFGHTIDEILVGDIFINYDGVHKNYAGREKGCINPIEIEFDDALYAAFKRFMLYKEFTNKEVHRILALKGKKIIGKDIPILCFDDFERRYLPKSREERLKKEETPEETGERLAKETIEKIKKDLNKKSKKKK
jgi:hypothetical protein